MVTELTLMRSNRRHAWAAFPILMAMVFAGPVAAQGLSNKEITDRIAKTYGVTVLKTVEAESGGKRILYVTVMNSGGNSNAAFQVTTLEVDPETGDLVSQYRTTPTGQVNGAPGRLEPSYDESGETMRQLSTRGAER